jgi:hypothetical protein
MASTTAGRPGWEVRRSQQLPEPTRSEDREHLVWREYRRQFAWFDRMADVTRWGYRGLRMVALVVGAVVTLLAAISAPAAVTAGLAAVLVVVEGTQQLFQFHTNWLSYRTTAEAMRGQALLFAVGAPPFADKDRYELLATSLHELTSKQNSVWATEMSKAARS